ncbi:MAG TPA: nuclear transport factor 2 family protein [Streptosporangiaceae bacterium]|nr:nuclear transport factor 2 family protein [Streptosporangiaceae bacterium]
MTTDSPRGSVERMFEAFGKGNLDALLETVHPESRWTYVGANPRLAKGVFVGRDGVRKFFEGILRNLTIDFQPAEFVTESDTVVVFGSESGTVNATGQPFRNEWAMKYVVRDGLITEMAEYNVQVEPKS